ncbi:PREDICTED: U-box domain-containing protein 35 [Populus euphratica]|uniref:RING-type E3 ubiquitin transferase n=1 Tax=Populus euphratica TaxID=75702 RepID=A0AAJ6TV53_POPEU|nr:PREDICTED: U-box domain-containing protein 35 [Populus euphratica]
MLNLRENAERRRGRERAIAVAIDKDKSSQSALIWAADNLVTRYLVLKLVHVKDRQNAVSNDHDAPEEQQTDSQTMDFFLPFRCFCRRRRVRCETVLLEDSDVTRALIGYVYRYGVDTLLLGGGSRNGLSRLFKTVDIPGTVLKRAPNFCTVYVVSKGKVSGLRNATRPVPARSAAGGALLVQRNSSVDLPPAIAESWYDELSPDHPDSPTESSERPSTDTTFFAFYENLGNYELTENLQKDLYMDERDFESTHSGSSSPVELRGIPEFKIFDNHAEPWLELNEEGHEDEFRRLKKELKQTIDMYHAALKEALAAKQKVIKSSPNCKVMELEHWKIIEEKRILEAHLIEETALKMVEWEKAKSRAANEAAEAAQIRVEIEVQKRIKAEKKVLKETEEKKKVLDALGQSHIVVKQQSLFHMIVVVLLFYFYFSVFK